ncbi:MAG: hypothetical protein Kapaf2KO_21360 [Candidatus Kapaibacteriales bacterium]
MHKVLKSIESNLKSFKRKEKSIQILTAFLLFLSISIVVLNSAILLEYNVLGESDFRTIIVFSALSIILVSGIATLGLALWKQRNTENIEDLALRVGRRYDEIQDKISNSFQLTRSYQTSEPFQKELAFVSAATIAEPFENYTYDDLLEKKRLLIPAIFLLISLGFISASYFTLGNSYSDAADRLSRYGENIIPAPTFSISIEELPSSVAYGSSFDVTIKAEGTIPEKATLYIDQGNGFSGSTLSFDLEGEANYRVSNAQSEISIFASSPWFDTQIATDTFNVTVIKEPSIISFEGTVLLPRYTGMPNTEFDNTNPAIYTLMGSSAQVYIEANIEEVSKAIVKLKSQEGNILKSIELTNMGEGYTGNFPVISDGFYSFHLESTNGKQNRDTNGYPIKTFADEFPIVKVFQEQTLDVPENGLLETESVISDDYGFSHYKLYYKLTKSNYTEPDKDYRYLDIPIENKSNMEDVYFVWDMNKAGISPSDEYEFYFEITDNDIISGPKSTKSQIFKAKLRSLEEIMALADENQEKIRKDMKKALEQSNEIKEKMEELRQDLLRDKNQKELSFDQKKKIE